MTDSAARLDVETLSTLRRTAWFQTVPPETGRTLERPKLAARIEAAVSSRPLTIAGAPPGYGKSTAVAEWARHTERTVAWLTSSRFDGDAARASEGVLTAVTRARGGDRDALTDVSTLTAARDVIAGVVSSRDELVLVVDQAEHLIAAHESLIGALVESPPPGLRILIVGTRPVADMELTLRTSGAARLSADDFALDTDEIMALSAMISAPGVDHRRADAVRARTSGWPIAVAAELASGGRGGSATSLEGYVEHVVLEDLPDELSEIIRCTVVTQVLSPALGVALTEREDAVVLLEECVRRGLFIDRFSDGGRCVYVWHAAFRDAMVQAQARRDPAGLRLAHLRAARELRRAAPLVAMEHFLAAERVDDAYDALLDSWIELLQDGDGGALERACASLPDDVADRPAVLAVRASCAWTDGDEAGAHRLMARIPESDDGAGPRERLTCALAAMLTLDDPAALRPLSATVSAALDDPRAIASRSLPHALLALGYTALRLRRGPVDAITTLRSALHEAKAQGKTRLAARAAGTLSFALAFAGEFTAALDYADDADEQSEASDAWRVYDGGNVACTRGFVAYWRGESSIARKQLALVREQARRGGGFQPVALMYDVLGAVAAHDAHWQSEAHERLQRMPGSSVLGTAWQSFRDCAAGALALEHGRRDDARRRADRIVAAVTAGEFAPVPLAVAAEIFRRLGDLGRARAIVAAADLSALTRPAQVRMLVTDALLRAAAGRDDAHQALERALDRAVPERLIQPFVEDLPELRALIQRHASRGTRHIGFVADILGAARPAAAAALSGREREVLAYLRTPLTLAEIGEALFVSVNTVKTHARAIYRKLGVAGRRDAVRLRL